MKILIYISFISTFLLSSCLDVGESFEGPAPGPWRGVLQLDPDFITNNKKGAPLPEKMNMKFEDINTTQLPFTFDVRYLAQDRIAIDIHNGTEVITVDDIIIGRDRKTAKDTILIDFPIYDSSIKAIYQGNVMAGDWIVHSKDDYRIPFKANFGKDHRFTVNNKKPVSDLSGKWKVKFMDDDESYMAIGEFKQDGNTLTGTFITETGDYRYLAGTVQADKMYLSCFDGSHAFLFEAKLTENNTILRGRFKSGTHYTAFWEATRDPEFSLADPNSLTYLKEGYDKMAFSFRNTEGELISLEDEQFAGKPKIIQIFGTWCPNCRDETEFLIDYLDKNPNPPFEIIALGFEKYKDSAKSMKALAKYKQKFDLPYPLLLAGTSNKAEAAAALPMLNAIISYPTMIFLDKNNAVKKIHTGFYGPATTQYQAFVEDFESNIENILTD